MGSRERFSGIVSISEFGEAFGFQKSQVATEGSIMLVLNKVIKMSERIFEIQGQNRLGAATVCHGV
jgi:hypothetical protein